MRHKELRLALVCYGGISLAVYMHGITKEIWRLTRASRNYHAGEDNIGGTQGIYREILETLNDKHDLNLRVIPDIIAGASAGGINGVFLAQAITSGEFLEPLTRLWLDCADIDILLDPDAKPWSRFSKFWAQPLVWLALSRPGGAVERTVSKDARTEVKNKLSRLMRARWFHPPFSGIGFSRLLYNATQAMAEAPKGPKLIPVGQPLDLFVTVTDFHGHLETLQLNSPEEVVETEHRLSIGFRYMRGKDERLADPAELVFAARSTASFPGAFPPFNICEIDQLLEQRQKSWPSREAFLERTFPHRFMMGKAEDAVLIDGSVLANAPFAQAIDALKNRPAHREVDRRFVYIDPKPDIAQPQLDTDRHRDVHGTRLPGFFSTIFGAISDIPREQPIRDNLDHIEMRTNRVKRMREINENLRNEVDETVHKLFGRTFFLDKPTAKRLANWRNKAQYQAASMSGFTYAAYGQLKLSGIFEEIVYVLRKSWPEGSMSDHQQLRNAIKAELSRRGLDRLTNDKGGATEEAIDFFRSQDLGFRIRRLRFLARRLSEDIAIKGKAQNSAITMMQETIYGCLSQYLDREIHQNLGESFCEIARNAVKDPARALDELAARRNLRGADAIVDEQLTLALCEMPKEERRELLLSYLGYPFYDIATLPLFQGEGLNEYDPIKVDRISPDDAQSIRKGGAEATLKGIEFSSFGAFFSRSYRENDYLWGRLHGAERMIDLLVSTVHADQKVDQTWVKKCKKQLFLEICKEERQNLQTDPNLVPTIMAEIEKSL